MSDLVEVLTVFMEHPWLFLLVALALGYHQWTLNPLRASIRRLNDKLDAFATALGVKIESGPHVVERPVSRVRKPQDRQNHPVA